MSALAVNFISYNLAYMQKYCRIFCFRIKRKIPTKTLSSTCVVTSNAILSEI